MYKLPALLQSRYRFLLRPFYLILVLLLGFTIYGQAQTEHNDIIGYRVKNRTVQIIADDKDSPNKMVIRILGSKFYFQKLDNKIPVDNIYYRKIYVPGAQVEENKAFDFSKKNEPEIEVFKNSDLGRYYWIKEDDMDDKLLTPEYKKYQRSVFGSVITAPFKGRLKLGNAKGDFIDGSFNLGSTLGYRFTVDDKGISYYAPFIFGQVTTLNFTSANNSSIKDLNTTLSGSGYSYGAGILFKFAGVTPGFIFGFDHAFGDNGATFIYQDKAWISFSLNFDFGSKKGSDNNKSKE